MLNVLFFYQFGKVLINFIVQQNCWETCSGFLCFNLNIYELSTCSAIGLETQLFHQSGSKFMIERQNFRQTTHLHCSFNCTVFLLHQPPFIYSTGRITFDQDKPPSLLSPWRRRTQNDTQRQPVLAIKKEKKICGCVTYWLQVASVSKLR